MKKVILIATGLLMVILTGCSPLFTSKTADTDKPKFVNGKLDREFRLKVVTPTDFNEFIIADKKGFLKEVGIIPEYTGSVPSGSLAQSVIKGDNHLFGSGHPSTIAAARKAGAPIKIVLHSMVDDPDPDKMHMTWFVRSGGPVTSPKDLVGKKIAMSGLGGCAEFLNGDFLRRNGIARDQVEIVVMKDAQQEQAIRQGLIDVAILHPPFNKIARNRGGLTALTTSYQIGEIAGNGALSGLAVRAFSEDFIKEYPDVVKAYIVADLKAQQYINEHYEESLQVAADFLKIDVKDMAGNIYPRQKWLQDEDIDFWVKLGERNGFFAQGEVKASDLYTNQLNPYYTGELK
ncbi:MAG: ABC transporter substrate-binding protein [Sporomusaceae bacterium]|nr:ABC transporter substrate-binding protein [Sporomusaceae bacterium]